MLHRTYFQVIEGPNGLHKIVFITPTFDHTHDPPPAPPEPTTDELEVTRMVAAHLHAAIRRELSRPKITKVTTRIRILQAIRMREYLHLSQRDLAAMLYCSRGGIVNVESGHKSNLNRSRLLPEMLHFLKRAIALQARDYYEHRYDNVASTINQKSGYSYQSVSQP